MRAVSLFSGIGGFELGLMGTAEFALMNEIDPAAQAVLDFRYPTVPRVDDVGLVRPEDLRQAALLVAGFPCQDVSIVGGQRGLGGEKSGLVRHMFRLAEAVRPDRLLLENVQSIRFVHGGRVLAYVMHEAERLGYRWAYRILDSRAFGLPQRRRRFYFLASRVDDPREVLLSDHGPMPASPPLSQDFPIGFYWTEGRFGHGLTSDALPPIKSGSAIGIPSPPAVLMPSGEVRLPTIETAERIQGFPVGWSKAAPARQRWRLVGNAVSPPVLEWLGGRLKNPGPFSAPGFDMPNRTPWPIAAWGDGKGRRQAVMLSEAPSDARLGRLSEGCFEWAPISSRALRGFVDRATDSRLSYLAGFLDSLRTALKSQDLA
ncbi:DNA cytosine methyltransferase [Brevundimonas sp.]|uniref:DNA cytosine methyltransferase n=1 Tax=Brevundimonas sp. TaxID=1871086 RepID=UPI0026393D40|nr:DNA (cytosine-5-)-methyltransferase [Brevundimonas sp.]